MAMSEAIDTTTVGVIGWRCIVCDAFVDISEALVFRCPNWTPSDPYHSLRVIRHDAPLRRVSDDTNPFLAYQPYFAWDSFAAENDVDEQARYDLAAAADARVAAVAGTSFMITPFERADALSQELGFTSDGGDRRAKGLGSTSEVGIWIKDETNQAPASHKARHLFSTMLHLLLAEA